MARLSLIALQTSKSPWCDQALEELRSRISPIIPFDILRIKSPSQSRDQKEKKIKLESELILKAIRQDDFLVLCDETGRALDSVLFSKNLVQWIESGKSRIVFLVGGAYGVHENVRSRANFRLSLSPLTFNHLVAQLVVAEQIYRGLAIWRRLPYHNS